MILRGRRQQGERRGSGGRRDLFLRAPREFWPSGKRWKWDLFSLRILGLEPLAILTSAFSVVKFFKGTRRIACAFWPGKDSSIMEESAYRKPAASSKDFPHFPPKIFLTKLFTLLILPLEELFVFFKGAQGELRWTQGTAREERQRFSEKGGDSPVYASPKRSLQNPRWHSIFTRSKSGHGQAVSARNGISNGILTFPEGEV